MPNIASWVEVEIHIKCSNCGNKLESEVDRRNQTTLHVDYCESCSSLLKDQIEDLQEEIKKLQEIIKTKIII